MIIREATSSDIPEIVQVLKASLGEKDLPLSEDIWNFKHIINPFGKSLVLVACEEDSIIGVRAFMRWQLHLEDRVYSCFRAVDTATHPNHQGKGVFKKLTLMAVEKAKEEKADFVFNFPNNKSRPGYLKMDWKMAGKIEVAIKPSLTSFWKLYKELPAYEINYNTTPKAVDELCTTWNSRIKGKKGLCTLKSHDYLMWRYEKNPLQGYEVLATDNFYLAASVKVRKNIRELRITECIFIENHELRDIKKIIRHWASKFGVQVTSFSPKLLNLLCIKGNIGPILTVRQLNIDSKKLDEFLKVENWTYSLGDLELF